MNVVDIVIIAILGLSVLVGLYRGFISSVASVGGCLLSLGLSFWLSPKLAAAIQNNPEILKTLVSYTDAATKIGDQTLANTSVASLSQNMITEILNKVSLPPPLNTLLQNNLEKQVFGAAVQSLLKANGYEVVTARDGESALGLVRGALLCFVAFALLPLIQTMVPVTGINELVSQSALAPLFNSGNLILAIMNGKLF